MNTKHFFKTYGDYIIVIVLFFISVICRWKSNFASALPSGVDGIYYSLQVRNILENGSMAFSDMPFVFWMEAIVAKLILLFTGLPQSGAIILACRLVNVFIPSLIVVPVFYLYRLVFNGEGKRFYLAVILALAVLNPSILVLFAVDFHKNAIGILFLYTALYFIIGYLYNNKPVNLVLSILSVAIILLTHFGCFSAMVLFILILVVIILIRKFREVWSEIKSNRYKMFTIVTLLALMGMFILCIRLFDSKRFDHLFGFVRSPFSFFKDSVAFSLLQGKSFLSGPRFVFFLILNIFSVLSLVAFFKMRKRLLDNEYIVFLSSVLWYVFLTSPFTGSDVYERLLFISLVPFTVIVIFVFRYLKKGVVLSVAIILSVLILLTVVTLPKRKSFISEKEYAELQQLEKSIINKGKTIVIARHGMEWWAAWILRTKVGLSSGIVSAEYPKYKNVLYLRRKADKNAEYDVANAQLFYDGEYFEVFKLYP